MGNTPSSEGSRRAPQKLSKPRGANPASTADLLSPNAPSVNGRFSNSYLVGSLPVSPIDQTTPDLSDATPEPEAVSDGEAVEGGPVSTRRLSRRDSRPLSGLFQSKSAHNDADAKRRSTGLLDRPEKPLSRANTMTQASIVRALGETDSLQTPVARESPPYNMSADEAQQLQDLLKDDSQNPPLSDTAHTPESQEASAPLSRVNSDTTLYAPMRRRSIAQTPGVATRSQTSSVPLSTKSSFRYSHPPTPSESRHNSMESKAGRHISLPVRASLPALPTELEAPIRVSTPCEADYRQLGGMRFGSLRIMNGSPVPSPGPDREHKERQIHSSRGPNSAVSSTYPFPLMKEAVGSEKPDDTRIVQPKPTTANAASLIMTQFAVKENQIHHDPKSLSPSTHPSPDSSSNFWGLQATSKHSEHDDNLFEDDVSESATPESLDLKEETAGKLEAADNPIVASAKAVKSVLKADSAFFSGPSEASRKPLAKVDSGYSSIISLRSIRSSGKKLQKTEPGSRLSEIQNLDSRGYSEFERSNRPGSTQLRASDETRSPDNVLVYSDALAAPLDTAHESPSPLSQPSVFLPLLETCKTPESQAPTSETDARSRSQSVGEALSALSAANSESSISRQSSGKSSHKRGRLHRLLSGARRKSLPTPYATHDITESIPSVPSDIQEKLREHNGQFPTAPKRLALRAETSKETLNTIASEESPQVAVPVTEVYSYVEPEVQSLPKTPRRRSLQTMSTSIANAATNIIPSRHLNRKSTPGLRKSSSFDMDDEGPDGIEDNEAHVASMDTIRQIMGNSAFDQAFTALTDERITQPLNTGQHVRPYSTRPKPPRPLKTVASAPDLNDLESDHLGPMGLFPLRKDRAPPPVSLRTRNSKKGRSHRPTPSRSNTTPALPAVGTWPLDPQFQGATPSHQNRPEMVDASPTSPSTPGQRPLRHRISYEGAGPANWRPPPPSQPQDRWQNEQQSQSRDRHQYGPRRQQSQQNHPAHRRHKSSGPSTGAQSPPFRVLHSYNSPAYRGVPVWG